MTLYNWLDVNLPDFFQKIGIKKEYAHGVITAHADKCYGAKVKFETNGLHFFHGVAIYLALSFNPYASNVRDTASGWVDPFQWIINNKDMFLIHLPKINS